jgi:uncharacterized protein YceH (UPF0502 family)
MVSRFFGTHVPEAHRAALRPHTRRLATMQEPSPVLQLWSNAPLSAREDVEDRYPPLAHTRIDSKCPICLERDTDVVTVECRHAFCKRCMDAVNESNIRCCPMCRAFGFPYVRTEAEIHTMEATIAAQRLRIQELLWLTAHSPVASPAVLSSYARERRETRQQYHDLYHDYVGMSRMYANKVRAAAMLISSMKGDIAELACEVARVQVDLERMTTEAWTKREDVGIVSAAELSATDSSENIRLRAAISSMQRMHSATVGNLIQAISLRDQSYAHVVRSDVHTANEVSDATFHACKHEMAALERSVACMLNSPTTPSRLHLTRLFARFFTIIDHTQAVHRACIVQIERRCAQDDVAVCREKGFKPPCVPVTPTASSCSIFRKCL